MRGSKRSNWGGCQVRPLTQPATTTATGHAPRQRKPTEARHCRLVPLTNTEGVHRGAGRATGIAQDAAQDVAQDVVQD